MSSVDRIRAEVRASGVRGPAVNTEIAARIAKAATAREEVDRAADPNRS
jgi:hypothetical protein